MRCLLAQGLYPVAADTIARPVGPVSLKITIDASRERVFDFICDLARRPGWTDHFMRDHRLERIDGAGQGAALRFRVDAPGGIGYLDTTIAEADRPHRIDERGRGGRFNRTAVRVVWELQGGEGSVTELAFTFWTDPPGPVERLREFRAAPWWRRRWRKALRRLREQLEDPELAAEPVRLAGGDRQPTGVHQ